MYLDKDIYKAFENIVGPENICGRSGHYAFLSRF